MKKILIANIFGIGDVLNTTPLIVNLKKAFENNISVDYLCNARTVEALENVPDVNLIFVYERDYFVKLSRDSKIKWIKALYNLFSDIKKQKYDVVFDFTLSREFGLFFTLAGIPRRVGLDYKKRGIFLTSKVPFKRFENRHIVEYYFDLLRCAGVPVTEKKMQLVPDEAGLAWVSDYFKRNGIKEDERILIIVPGGGASWGRQAPRRRWQTENFSYAADYLVKEGVRVAVVGDASEKELCRRVADKMKTAPAFVENSLTFKQYVALLSKSALVLCNDGGPLHVTVALGVKGVFVFGPVDDKVYGPYPLSDKHKVVTSATAACRPCYRGFKLPECMYNSRCLKEITPEIVAEKCLELLRQKD